ncbi:MAG: class I tRNA ligase family protein, partial [Ignavibacteria bacterium]|nr:class I tRNA ligase family protein [Ignavibacteria bacterium]
HHENEIAQAEAYGDGQTFAHYWMHNGFITVKQEKMSKSLGNFFTTREILQKFSPEALRLLYCQTLYSAPLNFSEENLVAAEHAVERIKNCIHQIKTANEIAEHQEEFLVNGYFESFESAMDDNFNTPQALAVMFELVKDVNTFLAGTPGLSKANKELILSTFKKLAQDVLGIIDLTETVSADESLVDSLLKIIIEIRNDARAQKRYDVSDKIRDELKKLNIVLEDKKGITTWKKI